jgi:chemotaxis protein methyltransferase CheR
MHDQLSRLERRAVGVGIRFAGRFVEIALGARDRSRQALPLGDTACPPILRREGICDLAALALRLGNCDAEKLAQEVVEAMTTNESLFFRDSKPFEHFRTQVLPRLAEARAAGAPLRLWSAAASTGQEAYSLAMILADSEAVLRQRKVDILGTDIARAPLARAREGLYSQFEVQRGLPVQMLIKHFRKEADGWRLSPGLRAAVEFREWNLLADLRPLGTFDVVFCRNVLLYFDQPTKIRVLEAIARQMAPDGVLYLGGTETMLGLTDRLRPLPEQLGAYATSMEPQPGSFDDEATSPAAPSGLKSPCGSQQEAPTWPAATGSQSFPVMESARRQFRSHSRCSPPPLPGSTSG